MKLLYLPNYKSQQRQFEKKNYNPYPVRMAMEAEWYREQGHFVDWEPDKRFPYPKDYFDRIISEPEGLPFPLPRPDRVFTQAKKYKSGNYKYLPGTHILSASGCWWGKCSFCVEKDKPYQVREVDDVLEEIEECRKLGFREVFDDAATLGYGSWLERLCDGLRSIRMPFSCNLRLDVDYPWDKMVESGFRMVLFGLESANQSTLERINKGVKIEEAVERIKEASKAGLSVHLAYMVGYSWESDEDTMRTLRLVHYLLRRGFADTAQASFYYPPNGESNPQHKRFIRKLYNCAFYPDFWFSQLKKIKDKDDIKYLWRKIKAGLTDYK